MNTEVQTIGQEFLRRDVDRRQDKPDNIPSLLLCFKECFFPDISSFSFSFCLLFFCGAGFTEKTSFFHILLFFSICKSVIFLHHKQFYIKKSPSRISGGRRMEDAKRRVVFLYMFENRRSWPQVCVEYVDLPEMYRGWKRIQIEKRLPDRF